VRPFEAGLRSLAPTPHRRDASGSCRVTRGAPGNGRPAAGRIAVAANRLTSARARASARAKREQRASQC